jgi:hypothetical protein
VALTERLACIRSFIDRWVSAGVLDVSRARDWVVSSRVGAPAAAERAIPANLVPAPIARGFRGNPSTRTS